MSETYRDVAITRDTRDELAEVATWLRSSGFHVNAAIIQRVVRKWDASEATESRAEGAA